MMSFALSLREHLSFHNFALGNIRETKKLYIGAKSGTSSFSKFRFNESVTGFHYDDKKITKNMGWCDDPYNKNYNKEIILNRKNKGEKFFRKDSTYDILIVIEYNTKKIQPFKGSAIFIHLTKNYKPTQGCIALKKNDLLILLRIIDKNSKIKIC